MLWNVLRQSFFQLWNAVERGCFDRHKFGYSRLGLLGLSEEKGGRSTSSEIILSLVRREGSIYGPIRFARVDGSRRVKETRAYIRPLNGKMYLSFLALMESALLLLIRSSACYGPAPLRF